MTSQLSDQLEVGVTYWPAAVGPYLWHEFHADTVRRDLTAIAAERFSTVRVMLSWDAFMPNDRAPNPRRMQELESLLNMARELGLRLVLTVFAQSIGDCVMLPTYAIDRRGPRPGVRCVNDARVVDGGPRDLYTDPLLLEVQVRWLDALLGAFASHPGVAAWELGHDPATTIRPVRIADMARWAALLGERVHAQGERCRLTLGQGDVVRGRGVRLAAVAEHVDVLGVSLSPQRLPLPGGALDAARGAFVADLAMALAGPSTALAVDVGFASGDVDTRSNGERDERTADDVTAPHDVVTRSCDELLQRLVSSGVTALHAGAWSDWGDRLREAPPSDRRPWLSHLGIVGSTGLSKPVARAWATLTASERPVTGRSPYPAAIDVESYYANLPDSLLDLYASWRGVRSDLPAILD